ncbi:MAG: sulfatase [Thermoplasmata archaeon]|nr:MAG: sulfatase [Thermoplasmata archaeon]UCG64756.1 MAG: sulfatase [Deltaproteobacteria bacterium]
MNVIVIVNDSFRWDFLGCYGNDWIKTPNLDKLASEGTLFKHFYPENLPTVPTRTTFFTGRYSFPFRGWQRLEPTDILLAETLWNKGFNTAMVTDVYHLHKPSMAFERGFDYTKHIRGHEGDPYIVDTSIEVDVEKYYKGDGKDRAVRAQLEQYLRNVHDWIGEEDTFVARTMMEGADWLQSQKNKDNLLLWVDCFDPHEPWDPPPPYNRMYTDPNYTGKDIIHPIPGWVDGYLTPEELNHIKMLYAGKVTLCDHWIGKFLDRVKDLGLYDNSLILFTTDHGAPFGEHGYIKKAQPGLHDDLVRIPLIVRHPEGLGAGKRNRALTQTTEIFPTILDFLNVKIPPKVHGKSLLPLMADEIDSIRDYAYCGHFKRNWRVNDHEWNFTLNFDKGKENELYNLKEDPLEQNNLVEREATKAMELELELRRFVASLK